MPTDQDTDTDEGTDAEISEETPDTDTDTHNPLQPVDPATNGNTDGEDVSTDSDDSDRPDSDSTEDSGETSTATAGTNTNTDDTDQQDSDQDNTNTAPAPPVDPNAETEVDSGTDQSGSSTAPDNRGTDPDEGGDNAGHEDADSMVPPPPVDQNNTAGSEQNESDGSENEPLTNGVDSTDTDGENSVAGPGPANSPGSVIINGTETEDQVLTATLNDADGLPDGVDIRYQWQRNTGADSAFENIDNATSKTYTLGDTDVGQTLRVQVSYRDQRGADERLISDATLAVTNVNDEPTGSVSIDGTAEEDQTLTANTDNLDDADGLGAFSYQWQRSNGSGGFENIENATGETYTLGDEDVGREVQVMVSYTDGNNTDESLNSTPTAEVGTANIAPTGSVRIDGTLRQGQQLSADTTALQDADGLPDDAAGYRYQWQRTQADGTFADIEDATDQTYTVEAADVGQRLQVVVRYTDNNGADEALTAATVSPAASNANDPVIDDANIMDGDANTDFLIGGAGNQRLNGLGGDDLLQGGAGADILDGGAGVDWTAYPIDSADIEIDLETGTAMGGQAEGDVLIRIENISGGDGNDRLTGNNADNILRGQLGDDILTGGSGNDLFRFRPDHGSDRITDFGTGDDRLEFREGLFANLEAVRAAATQTDDGNLEIKLSDTETLTLEGVTLAALTADTVTTLDEDDKDTTTPPADANSASDAPAFELDDLAMDEAALTRLAAARV